MNLKGGRNAVAWRTATGEDGPELLERSGPEPTAQSSAGSAGRAGDDVAPRRAKKKGLLGRFWLVLTIAAVVAVSGFVVFRLHGVFGVHKGSFGGGTSGEVLDEFNAKTITLQVWGSPGSTATINYLDENSHPQQALNVPLPWSKVLSSTKPGIPANLVAQGDGSWIACQFVVNKHDGSGDVIKTPNRSDANETVNPFVYCLDKSA
ncbi:MmpS family transport accessory protein [Mycobacterium sp. IEC1808]|uniref:MmpS family transport accessory protein n=1 Tax=Mycobacterium sp. IEC1808 TaxID=1743230 RepID=UPI001F4D5D91|nr:MmpS family transport accessory protein [Mycobacterium sp. IEC1808]